MIRIEEVRLPLEHEASALRQAASRRLGVGEDAIGTVEIVRRGYDARRRGAVVFVYTLDVAAEDEAAILARNAGDSRIRPAPTRLLPPGPRATPHSPRPVVIGAGPCGLLAATTLAELGYAPIVIERGKRVRERTVDTFRLWRERVLTPESNVQFGEGGAGTFSDGKLYSGISDPEALGRRVKEIFVACGAPEEILTISKPHVGTFRLVSMVERLRARLEALGAEYRFGCRVEDFLLETGRDGQRRLAGLALSDGTTLECEHAILAVGHSARDTFARLAERGVAMRAKPFSIGVRIEHPQSLIDRARFGPLAGHPRLGPADYKLAHHEGGRGIYSFCMCPGGTVVAAASEPGGVVTNGMSQYSRAERNANAGLVVEVRPADFGDTVLGGIALQRRIEARAFAVGGGDYSAPAQRLGDFLAAVASRALGDVVPSYKPSVTPCDLRDVLPGFVADGIRAALPHFARRLADFDLADAVMTAPETRTSSPVRIERDDSLQSPDTRGLYPAGEGAGYAGGILSAGVDGIRVALALARTIHQPVARNSRTTAIVG